MVFYGTAAGFRTYQTARGRDVPEYTDDAAIEAALLVASEWLDGMYRYRFHGLKVGLRDQEREWPRTGAQDRYGYSVGSNTVPTEIQNATYEATLKELETPGALNVDFTQSPYRSVRVDGAVSVQYAERTSKDVQTQFPAVEKALENLIGAAVFTSDLSSRTGRA